MTTCTNKNRKHNSLSVGINFFLTDHCNLNCKGCMAYAPLANKKFLSIDKFTNDLSRINLLSNNNIHAIHLLGGEPLLHLDCDKFIIISRKIFNHSIIRLFTNAILLQYMDKQFWMMLHDNEVILNITKYPVNINFEKIEDMADKHKVSISYVDVTTDNAWLSFKFKKYPNPSHVAMNTFLNCYQNDHSCHALVDGIYYPCGSAGRFHVLSKFTNNLFPPMKNGIDIYKVTSLEEILDFISTPIPLCQYCPVADIYYTTWDRSKKLLEEWIH